MVKEYINLKKLKIKKTVRRDGKKLSEADKQAVNYFGDWIKQGGLTQWIEHFLSAGDEAKLKQVKDIYDRIKKIFGF